MAPWGHAVTLRRRGLGGHRRRATAARHDRPHPLRPIAHWRAAPRQRPHRALNSSSPATRREFILRIEDTDRERSTEAATQVILDGLATASTPTRRRCSSPTCAAGAACGGGEWRCWPPGTPIAAGVRPRSSAQMRKQALAEGRPPRYDGRWRDRDPAEAPPGVAPAIRIKAPRDGEHVVSDLVQGEVRVANAELDDMIILRSDGMLTYLHAVVVDDHDMGGDARDPRRRPPHQHFSAVAGVSARWAGSPPNFAHIPLIDGADGAKLSKRHGAVSVAGVPRAGFLARGALQLSAAAGLGAWRSGDPLARAGDRAVRSRRRWPCGVAHGLREAHPHQLWCGCARADDEFLARETLRAAGAPAEPGTRHGPARRTAWAVLMPRAEGACAAR